MKQSEEPQLSQRIAGPIHIYRSASTGVSITVESARNCTVCHCAYLSLCHNRTVQHFVGDLNLRGPSYARTPWSAGTELHEQRDIAQPRRVSARPAHVAVSAHHERDTGEGGFGSLLPPLLPLPPGPLQSQPRLFQHCSILPLPLLLLLPPHLLPLHREKADGGVETFPGPDKVSREGTPAALQDKAASTHCGPGSSRAPGRVLGRRSLLSPWRVVRLVDVLLSRPFHHRPRGLCTVVEGRRQLHPHRELFVAAEGAELAVRATPGTPDAAFRWWTKKSHTDS